MKLLAAISGGLFVGAVSGCWSSPERYELGFRSDDEVLTFLLPLCPEDRIIRACVAPFDANSAPPPVWIAQEFSGKTIGPVQLSSDAWEVVQGDYSQQSGAIYNFETSRLTVGASEVDVEEVSDLPEGEYQVGDTLMTIIEYRDYVESKIKCQVP